MSDQPAGGAATRRTISVMVPVFNEEDNVGPMCAALRELAASQPEFGWEFVFVDDGSRDRTVALLLTEHRTDARVKIVQLSRNFGPHIADSAGLQFVSGDAVVIIAADLQDHPREIPRFIEKWGEGFDVVWGVRAQRDDAFLDRLMSRIFAELIRRIALANYPPTGTGGFCLVDRICIDAFNAYSERNRSVSGLILFTGFRQTQVLYHRQRRKHGRSKWSLRRKVRTAVNTIVAFSVMPLRIASFGGLAIAGLAFVYMVIEIVGRILYGTEVPGFTQSVVLLLMLGGFQLSVLGILGEYVWRVLDDVRRRPLFLVQRLYGEFKDYRPPLPPFH